MEVSNDELMKRLMHLEKVGEEREKALEQTRAAHEELKNTSAEDAEIARGYRLEKQKQAEAIMSGIKDFYSTVLQEEGKEMDSALVVNPPCALDNHTTMTRVY